MTIQVDLDEETARALCLIAAASGRTLEHVASVELATARVLAERPELFLDNLRSVYDVDPARN
ncbi:MAG: hypothetical protein SFU53_05650 [Terrimicrobiaceae bacterium]|nr:hypothetical protein [Terrimicrobiaceae bacterium]